MWTAVEDSDGADKAVDEEETVPDDISESGTMVLDGRGWLGRVILTVLSINSLASTSRLILSLRAPHCKNAGPKGWVLNLHKQEMSSWYAFNTLEHMKAFMVPCTSYHDSSFDQLMVVCFWLPWFTYVVVTFLCVYDKTLFHWCNGIGLFVTSVVIWAFSYLSPNFNPGLDCDARSHFRPSDGASIAFFQLVYWTSPHFLQFKDKYACIHGVVCNDCFPTHRRRYAHTATQALVLFSYALICSYAPVYLHLARDTEAVIGAVLGAVCAEVSVFFLYSLFVPNFAKTWFQTILRCFCVNGARLYQ